MRLAQQCWQVPPGLFAQVTPRALLWEGGGSTSEGTAQRCPLLPTASGLFPAPSPQPPVLVLCPRCQAQPLAEGSRQEPLAPQEGRFALQQRSAAGDRVSHRPLPPPCLLLSQRQCKGGISVQKRILQHLTHPLHWCERGGGFGPAPPEGRLPGNLQRRCKVAQDLLPSGRWTGPGLRSPPRPAEPPRRLGPDPPASPQARPALLPVLFLKEYNVLFQCRDLCTVLTPRFPSLFYCTIMAVAGSWCNMEVFCNLPEQL